MDLCTCGPGADARVVSVDLDDAVRHRMHELGLRPGARVRVVQRTVAGGLVVALGADRFGLDAATARRVEVEATQPAAAPSTTTSPATGEAS